MSHVSLPRTLALALLLSSIGGAAAAAASGPACGRFVVFAEIDKADVVDVPPEGYSPGDLGIVRNRLLNDDGSAAGTEFILGTAMRELDGNFVRHVSIQAMFANGTVTSLGMLITPMDPPPDKVLKVPFVRSVTGGTGDFARATGTVTSTLLDDGRRQVVYDIVCPK